MVPMVTSQISRGEQPNSSDDDDIMAKFKPDRPEGRFTRNSKFIYAILLITVGTCIVIIQIRVVRGMHHLSADADAGKSESFGLLNIPVIDPGPPTVSQRFEEFFDNPVIRKFKINYIAACFRRQTDGNNLILGAVLNATGNAGFGSVLTNALNAYVVAQDPKVDRTFQLVESLWEFWYSMPSALFEDFSATSPCPLYTIYVPSIGALEVHMDNATKSLNFTGSDQAYLPYFGQAFGAFRDTIMDIVNRDGLDRVFAVKSGLVRAIWNPKSVWKKLLKTLWTKMLDANGRYFAVHIRRGDKIAAKEMTDIPAERYFSELIQVCSNLNTACPQNVFVMHDDRDFYQQLQNFTRNRLTLFDLGDLMAKDELKGHEDYVLKGHRGGHDTKAWQRHSRELVISMTLTAMADRVVCTFSSNLCRLVALIKGDLSVFHSLDKAWSPI